MPSNYGKNMSPICSSGEEAVRANCHFQRSLFGSQSSSAKAHETAGEVQEDFGRGDRRNHNCCVWISPEDHRHYGRPQQVPGQPSAAGDVDRVQKKKFTWRSDHADAILQKKTQPCTRHSKEKTQNMASLLARLVASDVNVLQPEAS